MGTLLAVLLILISIAIPILMLSLPIYFLRKHKNNKLRRETGKCKQRGKEALQLRQTAIKGMVVVAELRLFKEWLCLEHGQELYNTVRSYNLKSGWWSLLGIIRTPFVLQENHYEFSRFSKELKKINK